MEKTIKNFLSKSWEEGAQINRLNALAATLVGTSAHFLFYFIFKYVFDLPYENFALRMMAVLLCMPAFFIYKKIGVKLQIYWHIMLIFVLPFIFTTNLIKTGFHDLWLWWEIFMIFVLIMYIPNWFVFLCDLFIGIGGAILFCVLTPETTITAQNDFNIILYILVIVFTAITGWFFAYSNLQGTIAQTRAKSLESLGGSIAHEMRNPLGSIHQSAYILIKKLQKIPESKEVNRILISKKEKKELEELLEIIDHSSVRGNMVIDMILSNIKGKEIDKSKFKVYKVSEVIEVAIKEFAFAGSAERAKVSSNIKHDFYFKGDENMLVFVLFNLLKNALYYLKAYPKSRITISAKKEDKGEGKFNYLYFRDTGPGIPKDKLEDIFDSFMTSGKAEGTGLGLPFCRRVITAFDGKIVCNSEVGKYTEFAISFPKLSKEDEERKEELIVKKDTTDYEVIIKEKYDNKVALLADDQLVNRRISANRLEHLGLKVFTAEHGKDALKILETQGDEIDIIFMDLQMPEIDGYEATKLIKSGKKNKEGDKFKNFKKYKNIPIIAFTGDDDDETISKVKECGMQGHIGKSWNNKQLLEILDKAIS